MSDLEQEGVIQRFEYSYALAWKTMKDYLEENGLLISPITPRNVIKEAFAAGMIDDGQVWIDMMLHRNLLSRAYDFSRFKEVLNSIESRYLDAFETIHEWFTAMELDELSLPYKFDVKSLEGSHNQALTDHIFRVGVNIYPEEANNGAEN